MTAEVKRLPTEEYDKLWAKVAAVVRLARITGADPRKLPAWKLHENDRAIVTLDRWLTLMEARNGEPFDFTGHRFEIDVAHSALIPWMLNGNEPLPHPPPIRFSYPDHAMALTGTVVAHEVWRRPQNGVDACVDQSTRGWFYVSGSKEEGHFVLLHMDWGTWEFTKRVETRQGRGDRTHTTVYWDGKRTR